MTPIDPPGDAWVDSDPMICPFPGCLRGDSCDDLAHLNYARAQAGEPPLPSNDDAPPHQADADGASVGRPVEDRDDRTTTPPRPRLVAQPAIAIMQQPRPVEIVEGVAFADCVTVLVSESGAGKTFLLLSLAAAISDDLSWMGRTTQSGSVVYIGFEGDALGTRLRALTNALGHRLMNLFVLRAADPLSPRITREGVEQPSSGELQVSDALDALIGDLRGTGRPPVRVMFIDTIRASLSGSEDSSEHVSAYLRAVRRLLARVPGAAAMLAHHAGWQDAAESSRKRERGSSAFRGNVDGTLYLEAGPTDDHGEARLVLRTLKIRDAERPAPLNLIRRRVELLESDGRGQPVTSCVIERDRRTREDREAEASAGLAAAHRALDLKTLRAIADHPEAATSQAKIGLYLTIRKLEIGPSLARLAQAGWIAPGGSGKPHLVTEAGRLALAEGTPS